MKKIFNISLSLIFIFFIASCGRHVSYKAPLLKEAKSITLVAIVLEKEKNQKNEKHLIHYPSLNLKVDAFFDSLITTFNTNPYEIKINFLDNQEIEKINGFSPVPEVYKIQDEIILKLHKERDFFKYFSKWDSDYLAVVYYANDPWLQRVWGSFKVYNQEKKLIWNEEIKFTSNYIIYDENTPYKIRNRSILVPTKKSNHHEEIGLVYEKLGETFGLALIETLTKVHETP